jgi:hypothetical protein
MDQVLHNNMFSGLRVKEQKLGVTGKSYSLEGKLLSTKVVCECRKE